MSQSVLVTGGAGFIGSHLVDALLRRGDSVIVVDNFNDFYSPASKRKNLEQAAKHKNFRLYEADVRDEEALRKIFTGNKVDVVAHLAARAGVRPSLDNPRLYFDVNVMGSVNVLEQMKRSGVQRLVFASSSSVYGDRDKGPFKETDNTDSQVSPYGASKKAGEVLCRTYAHLYDIQTTVLRFFTVYGPRNRPDMACYLFMDAIHMGQPLTQFGDGNSGRDYTFISDTVSGILAAVDSSVPFDIINIGNSAPLLLKDFISEIEAVVGSDAVITQSDKRSGDVQLTYASIEKAHRLLKYSPKHSLKDGLQATWQWYQAQAGNTSHGD